MQAEIVIVEEIKHPTTIDAEITPKTMEALRLYSGKVIMPRDQAVAAAQSFAEKNVIKRSGGFFDQAI